MYNLLFSDAACINLCSPHNKSLIAWNLVLSAVRPYLVFLGWTLTSQQWLILADTLTDHGSNLTPNLLGEHWDQARFSTSIIGFKMLRRQRRQTRSRIILDSWLLKQTPGWQNTSYHHHHQHQVMPAEATLISCLPLFAILFFSSSPGLQSHLTPISCLTGENMNVIRSHFQCWQTGGRPPLLLQRQHPEMMAAGNYSITFFYQLSATTSSSSFGILELGNREVVIKLKSKDSKI